MNISNLNMRFEITIEIFVINWNEKLAKKRYPDWLHALTSELNPNPNGRGSTKTRDVAEPEP